VPARNLLLFVAAMLLLATVAAALAPREEEPAPASRAGRAPAAPAAREVSATLPEDAEVRVRLGDVVRLQVRAGARDVATIAALGVTGPVEPEVPAELLFTADREGRFAVVLEEAGRRVGVVEVGPAR